MPTFLISKIGDPLFALSMGVSAALVRIRREQREKHSERAGEIGYGSVLETGMGRLRRWWAGDFKGL